MESPMENKSNKPLITTADVGRETSKNRVSETVEEGLKILEEEDADLSEEYKTLFTPDELNKIDLIVNKVGADWNLVALADNPTAVKKAFREALNGDNSPAKEKEIRNLLQ